MLAYRGSDKLYVPSDQVDSVCHYTGGDTPALSRMGGSDWSATKQRVRSAVAEVARDLVRLYQKRLATAGHAFSGDTPWQSELEDAFGYEETPDQIQAVADVKADMERPMPMDRLVVGDVGFGKTEVAVRAVFKAVQDDRQAALLVPTTLLAHPARTDAARPLRPFPVAGGDAEPVPHAGASPRGAGRFEQRRGGCGGGHAPVAVGRCALQAPGFAGDRRRAALRASATRRRSNPCAPMWTC